ncbi:PH domain-containing protein [Nonomuraea longicatena]|uniref:PH domain-containing protein n=1 Tax=Nonomuraea longicatena TaxID=83682 RepID=A0ABN1NM08_9ACTN
MSEIEPSPGALRDPEHRVSPKARQLWLLESLIGFVLFVGGAVLVSRWVGGSGWAWVPDWLSGQSWLLPAGVAVVMAPFLVAEPFVRYAVHRWELSDDVVYARSGFLTREWVFVPVSRIQTVDKAQGWLERLLGLATLEIRTASHAGSSSIKGLDYRVAAGLADRLAHRAEQLRDDAT